MKQFFTWKASLLCLPLLFCSPPSSLSVSLLHLSSFHSPPSSSSYLFLSTSFPTRQLYLMARSCRRYLQEGWFSYSPVVSILISLCLSLSITFHFSSSPLLSITSLSLSPRFLPTTHSRTQHCWFLHLRGVFLHVLASITSGQVGLHLWQALKRAMSSPVPRPCARSGGRGGGPPWQWHDCLRVDSGVQISLTGTCLSPLRSKIITSNNSSGCLAQETQCSKRLRQKTYTLFGATDIHSCLVRKINKHPLVCVWSNKHSVVTLQGQQTQCSDSLGAINTVQWLYRGNKHSLVDLQRQRTQCSGSIGATSTIQWFSRRDKLSLVDIKVARVQ